MEQKRNATDDIMTGLMIMLFAIVSVIFFAPALLFTLVIVLLARELPWYVTAAGLLICLLIGLGIVHFTGCTGFKSYLFLLATSIKIVLTTGKFTGFPWLVYIGSAFLFGPLLSCVGLAVLPNVKLPRERRRSKNQSKRNRGFVDNFMLARLAKTKHPEGKTLLGVSERGNTIEVSDQELNQHCFLVGTTGSGKTVTLGNFTESAIQRGIPLVYVDGKGESQLVADLKRMAEKHGRKFYLFSVNGHPDGCRWNPLARGQATEKKDKLISLTDWTEPHYRYEAERYLQAVFMMFEALNKKSDIPGVAQYLYPKIAHGLAREIKDEGIKERLLEELSAGKTVEGLANRIAVLAASEIGNLFQGYNLYKKQAPAREEKESNINLGDLLGLEQEQLTDALEDVPIREEDTRPILDLDQAIREQAVVLFSLNSLRFRDFSQLIGRLVVNDLRTTIARRYDRLGRDYIFGVFDEFHVFASIQVVDILAQARGAGFCTLIATQSLSDLDLVDRSLTGRIVENCNTFIIQAQNYPENAERLASIIGTQDSLAQTYQVEGYVMPVGTGMGTYRETREFIVHPDEIKRLRTGEAVLVRKAGRQEPEKIWVRRSEG